MFSWYKILHFLYKNYPKSIIIKIICKIIGLNRKYILQNLINHKSDTFFSLKMNSSSIGFFSHRAKVVRIFFDEIVIDYNLKICVCDIVWNNHSISSVKWKYGEKNNFLNYWIQIVHISPCPAYVSSPSITPISPI